MWMSIIGGFWFLGGKVETNSTLITLIPSNGANRSTSGGERGGGDDKYRKNW